MKRSIIIRLWNLVISNGNRFLSSYSYKKLWEWHKLKNKYCGKRVFLIANGPSLNITPLFLLKNEYTIVFNLSKLMLERLNYNPSFYMLTDGSVGQDIKEEIVWWAHNCKQTFIPDIMKGEMIWLRKVLDYNDNIMWMFEEPMSFSRHLPFVKPGATVIFEAFQVLKYMGFSEVVVVGNDMNYVIHESTKVLNEIVSGGKKTQQVQSQKDDDPNHFDPRYFGKGKVYHQPTQEVIDRIFDNLDYVAKEYEKDGVRIVNAGYNSKVKSFPKQDFYECLGYSDEKIDMIFEELVLSKGFGSLKEFLDMSVEGDAGFDKKSEIVAIPVTMAEEVVKNNILEYLPLGPYKSKVYFINRKIIKS